MEMAKIVFIVALCIGVCCVWAWKSIKRDTKNMTDSLYPKGDECIGVKLCHKTDHSFKLDNPFKEESVESLLRDLLRKMDASNSEERIRLNEKVKSLEQMLKLSDEVKAELRSVIDGMYTETEVLSMARKVFKQSDTTSIRAITKFYKQQFKSNKK